MLNARRKAYLAAMDIELWQSRSVALEAAQTESVELAFSNQKATVYEPVTSPQVAEMSMIPDAAASSDWPELADKVRSCQQCGLSQTRTQTVFGVGDQQADLMIVGEAPGADEDRQGFPFVGRAGQLLTAMLKAIGLSREQVYIANVLKCRPPGNRDPMPNEVDACRGYLDRQIALIQPRLILSVGGVSAKNLLKTDQPVGRLRGKLHQYAATETPLMVTYHPAYLLRRPEEKAKVWADLQQVVKHMG